jgi:hypothetical protein
MRAGSQGFRNDAFSENRVGVHKAQKAVSFAWERLQVEGKWDVIRQRREVPLKKGMSMKAFLFATALGVMVAAPLEAQALPVSSANQLGAPSDVTQVAGGCGYGWHRGPWGGCRRNWRPLPGRGVRCWFHPSPWGPRRVCARF